MPQLDPATFAPQLIWLAITFLVLYVLMATVGLPKVGKVIEVRRNRIESDLNDARRLKTESEAVLTAYELALTEARLQAQAQIRKTLDQLNVETAERQRQATDRLFAETAEAEARIAKAKAAALANLSSLAVEIARDAATKLVGFAPDEASAQAAVDVALKERF